MKASQPWRQTSKMAWIHLGSTCCIPKEREQQHSKRVPQPDDNDDDHHHNHRPMTMIIKDNDHGDQDDKKEDWTDIPKDSPSEEFRTSNPRSGPEFHKNQPKTNEKRTKSSSKNTKNAQRVGQFLSLDPRVEGSRGITSGLAPLQTFRLP